MSHDDYRCPDGVSAHGRLAHYVIMRALGDVPKRTSPGRVFYTHAEYAERCDDDEPSPQVALAMLCEDGGLYGLLYLARMVDTICDALDRVCLTHDTSDVWLVVYEPQTRVRALSRLTPNTEEKNEQ